MTCKGEYEDAMKRKCPEAGKADEEPLNQPKRKTSLHNYANGSRPESSPQVVNPRNEESQSRSQEVSVMHT